MQKLSTELNDRTLRFDGVSILDPERVPSALALGIHPSALRVSSMSEDVLKFNEVVILADKLHLDGNDPIAINMLWQLPEQYKNLDLDEYVMSFWSSKFFESDEYMATAAKRIVDELAEIRRRGMIDFMKTVIYVLDIFRKNNVIWGVGRGSSCASYVLFVLGLHAVDCIKLDVPMEEFFHD